MALALVAPDKCDGCRVRDADPRECWYFTLTKSVKLCTRCARLLARRFPGFVRATCRPGTPRPTD